MNKIATKIPGYELVDILHNGSQSIVYRAIQLSNQHPIIIKIPKKEYLDFNELLKFRNQYTIIKSVNIKGIIKPLALSHYMDKVLLIMPDSGSISLSQYLKENIIDINNFINFAMSIVSILKDLTRYNIIHKDIKPDNILINPNNNNQLHLIDFSISTTLAKERLALNSINTLEGTLAYMPPEQTGRMNRGIDYRSDFYSLGITFYQMLTGELPFKGNDAMELVHSHLAKIAKSPTLLNKNIPEPISQIILKLMEKNAEARYQSAEGLLSDLEQCKKNWTKGNKISSFKLGQHDIAKKLAIPEKLYGRKQEVILLHNTFDKMSLGHSSLLLITGSPGIGKTALVNEIHRSIVREHGYFIKGKYEQFNRNKPYLAIVQALQMLFEQLRNQHSERYPWKKLIQNALGQEAQVLIDLVPELELLIGVQKKATKLEGEPANNRFENLFLSLFKTISKVHPIVIFLDDLQWVDSASLQLLSPLLTASQQPLLLIGAYRDSEVQDNHPWLNTLQDLRNLKLLIKEIHLSLLAPKFLQQMIIDACFCKPKKAQDLSELIYKKTKGNPFFIHRFLKILSEENLVQYHYETEQWNFNLEKIAQLTMSDDVIDFIKDQIIKLPEETRQVLQQASCIGNIFDLEILSIILGYSKKQCAKALWIAMQADFIIALSRNYKYFLDDEAEPLDEINEHYRFSHDRIQQATYGIILDNNKAEVHLKIGRLLQNHKNKKFNELHLLGITNQLNLGKSLIKEKHEKIELVNLNYLSAKRSQSSLAYESAAQYCNNAIALLNKDCWRDNYSLSLSIYESAAEIAFLQGSLELLLDYKSIITKQAINFVETSKVHHLYCLTLIAKNEPFQMIEYGLKTLQKLGFELPLNPTEQEVSIFFNQVQILIQKYSIDDLLNHSKMNNETALAASQLILTIGTLANNINPNLFSLLMMKGVKLSLKYGISPTSSIGFFSGYGQILITKYNDIDRGYQYGQLSLKLLEKIRGKEYIAQVYTVVYGVIIHWKEPLKHSIKPSKAAYQSGFETGDYLYSSLCTIAISMASYFSSNELLQLSKSTEEYIKAVTHMKQYIFVNWHNIIYQSILNLLGRSATPWLLKGKALDEDRLLSELKKYNDQFGLCTFHIHKMILCYLFHKIELGQQNLHHAEASIVAVLGTINTAIFHFYGALIQLEDYKSSSNNKPQYIIKKVSIHLEKMKTWATHAPMNFQHKYDLMMAERCQVTNEWLNAENYYEKAISGAHENGYIQEEALANELAARFFLKRKNKNIARMYMVQAYYAYANWGAKAKTDDLEKRYPELLAVILHSQQSPQNYTSIDTQSTEKLDLCSVLKSTQTLSSKLNLSNFLESLLNIVMENAGARRSVLILNDDNEWLVAAECQMDIQQREILPGYSLTHFDRIPKQMINYVIEKKKVYSLENAQDHYHRFHNDPYFKKTSDVKSVLCQPILLQAKLMGLLYIENTLTIGAFDEQRLQMLEMLASQAAISIENAHLYKTLEDKVIKRTQELKQAQAILIKQAKEAGMAEIAIGVMHNIGNALTPAKVVVSTLRKRMHNSALRHALEPALKDLPRIIEKSPDLADNEKTRLSRLLEILPKSITDEYDYAIEELAGVTKKHEHIENVIHLQMKYADAEKITQQFDFNKLVDDAVQMLVDTIKNHAIDIQTDFTKLSVIHGDENKLLQVLINIIKNACEAMSTTPKQERKLMISTLLDDNDTDYFFCQIKDHGIGFTDKTKEKIFNFGFTTKESGLGFGLHACANDVFSMGGALEGLSEGLNLGAIFILRLPFLQHAPKM